MPPPSSDPFDDDDFFSDPAALNAIAAIEERAIAASQVPKKHGIHHTVAPPGSGPRARPAAAVLRGKAPPPINTNPVARGCGFGWEPGGKNAARMAAGQAVRDHSRVGAPADDEPPPDVVLNDKGQYGFGSADDEPIIDERTRPEIRQLVDGGVQPKSAGGASAPGSQARRDAIFSALPPLGARAPMQRSTSSNSTAGPSNPPKFAPRTLARSVSTGSHSLMRDRQASRPPGGLSPIGSQSSQALPSQGAASRRAVFELEEERRLRQTTEAEVRALRARLAAVEERGNSPPWKEELQEGDQAPAAVSELKEQLWAAQGQASTAKRNQEMMEARLLAEIDKLKSGLRDAQAQMKTREHEAQQRIESMKTQAIFSNHAALASASKARQSQWTASQRAAGQTPLKPASPLRDKSMTTPAPLTRSAKGKTPRPPPPRFDSLSNAFAATPNVGRKRQRTAAPSPTTTPKKSRIGSVSPMVSPLRSGGRSHPPSEHDLDVSMDWQPDFHAHADAARDPRAELVHHILHHTALTAIEMETTSAPSPSIVRLIQRNSDFIDAETGQSWFTLCSHILHICSDPTKTFHDLSHDLMGDFAGLFRGLANQRTLLTWTTILLQIDLFRFVASTVFLFPTLPASNHDAARSIAGTLNHFCQELFMVSGPDWFENPLFDFHPLDPGTEIVEEGEDKTLFPTLRLEFVNALMDMAEALSLADGKCVWVSSALSTLILYIGQQTVSEHTLPRALDLFIAASCRPDHFRALLFKPDMIPDVTETSVIDMVARFFIDKPTSMSSARHAAYTCKLLAALYLLSRADPDAVILMADRSLLVPALIMLIHRESARVWGVHSSPSESPLAILAPAVTLLHHLVYPAPQGVPNASTDDLVFDAPPPQGVDLARRLQEAGASKDYNGVQHVFVTSFGAMAFAEVDVDGDDGGGEDEAELRMVQFLAQDLLDAVVEGPEGDSVYAIYVSEEEGDEGEAGEEEEEEEDYGEEERLMGAEPWDDE